MREELGLIEGKYSPMVSAANTFLGFNAIGMIPLIPFIFVYLYGSNVSISNALLYNSSHGKFIFLDRKYQR